LPAASAITGLSPLSSFRGVSALTTFATFRRIAAIPCLPFSTAPALAPFASLAPITAFGTLAPITALGTLAPITAITIATPIAASTAFRFWGAAENFDPFRAVEVLGIDIRDMKESIATDTKVDKRRLDTRLDIDDAAFINVADVAFV
jgi:hypothetical protein